MNVPTNEIKQADAAVGESAKAARIIDDAGFNEDAKGKESNGFMELVLLQSDKLTVDDPAFKAAIADTEQTLRSNPRVTELMPALARRSTGHRRGDGRERRPALPDRT